MKKVMKIIIAVIVFWVLVVAAVMLFDKDVFNRSEVNYNKMTPDEQAFVETELNMIVKPMTPEDLDGFFGTTHILEEDRYVWYVNIHGNEDKVVAIYDSGMITELRFESTNNRFKYIKEAE